MAQKGGNLSHVFPTGGKNLKCHLPVGLRTLWPKLSSTTNSHVFNIL